MDRLPEGALMQRAATGLAVAIADLLGSTYAARVLLLVGAGDNGGDALWAGARLARRGVSVEAVLLSSKVHADGLAALRAAGGRTVLAADARRPDVVVDGIVGIGGRPGLREEAEDALGRFPGVPVVAVDVPSGVDVDTGQPRRAACARGPDRHVRHPQDRPPRRPGRPGLRRGAPRRHRAGAAGGAGGGVAAGRRRCAVAGAVGVRAQVHPRCRRGPRRLGDLSGGCGAVHLGCGDRPRRDGPLPRLRRGRGACPAPRGRDSRGPGAGVGRRVGRRCGRARRR